MFAIYKNIFYAKVHYFVHPLPHFSMKKLVAISSVSLVMFAALSAGPLLVRAETVTPEQAHSARNILFLFMQPDSDADGVANFDYASYFSHMCYGIITAQEEEDCMSLFGAYHDLKAVHDSGMLQKIIDNSDWYLSTNPEDMDMTIDAGIDAGTGTVVVPELPVNARIFDMKSGLYMDEKTGVFYDSATSMTPVDLSQIAPNRRPQTIMDTETGKIYNRMGGYPANVRDEAMAETDQTQTNERSARVWKLCGQRYGIQNQSACHQSNIRLVTDISVEITPENVNFGSR